jgi:hypothetical protein
MNFVPLLLVHLCNTLPALSMLMIARCGVTAETACWLVCEQSCSTKSCQHHQRCITCFVPLLLVHL